MMHLFPSRCSPHRRRAAWSAWWDAQRRLQADRRFLRTPAFDPMEDDWLRLTERGILIGTTGFFTPEGRINDGPWPMHGGYFEKPGLWVRGAEPLDWVGRGRRWNRRVDLRPTLVGVSLSPLKNLDGDAQDRKAAGSRIEALPSWTLPGHLHPFNPPEASTTVQAVLERPARGRPWDDHPVIHVFGPTWWTRAQVEDVVDRVMNVVRDRLSDGYWLDPEALRHGLEIASSNTRGDWRHRVSDLIDLRDFQSDKDNVLPSAGDRRVLTQAGGTALLNAVQAQWRQAWRP